MSRNSNFLQTLPTRTHKNYYEIPDLNYLVGNTQKVEVGVKKNLDVKNYHKFSEKTKLSFKCYARGNPKRALRNCASQAFLKNLDLNDFHSREEEKSCEKNRSSYSSPKWNVLPAKTHGEEVLTCLKFVNTINRLDHKNISQNQSAGHLGHTLTRSSSVPDLAIMQLSVPKNHEENHAKMATKSGLNFPNFSTTSLQGKDWTQVMNEDKCKKLQAKRSLDSRDATKKSLRTHFSNPHQFSSPHHPQTSNCDKKHKSLLTLRKQMISRFEALKRGSVTRTRNKEIAKCQTQAPNCEQILAAREAKLTQSVAKFKEKLAKKRESRHSKARKKRCVLKINTEHIIRKAHDEFQRKSCQKFYRPPTTSDDGSEHYSDKVRVYVESIIVNNKPLSPKYFERNRTLI